MESFSALTECVVHLLKQGQASNSPWAGSSLSPKVTKPKICCTLDWQLCCSQFNAQQTGGGRLCAPSRAPTQATSGSLATQKFSNDISPNAQTSLQNVLPLSQQRLLTPMIKVSVCSVEWGRKGN